MCGRYTLTIEQEALQVALGVEGLLHPAPRFNVAPSQKMPAVTAPEGDWRSATLRWGLVPFWAKEPSIGNRLINARCETAHEKPAFRQAFRQRRCLIPADGFYEWNKEPGGKRPFWIHLEDPGVFTMAGLWERWTPKDGDEALETFTILTTDANELLRPIHPRMPVILAEEDRARWLDPAADQETLRSLLGPAPAPWFGVREVTTRVNSPANDDPGCLDPPAGPGEGLPLFDGPG